MSLLSLLRYALYLARAAKAYRDDGIAFEHLAIQNEPNQDSSCGAYPKMGWTGEALHEFVRDHLGPTFESEGIAHLVGIFLSTFPVNDFDGFVNPTLNDSSTAKCVTRAHPLACNECTLDTYAHEYSFSHCVVSRGWRKRHWYPLASDKVCDKRCWYRIACGECMLDKYVLEYHVACDTCGLKCHLSSLL